MKREAAPSPKGTVIGILRNDILLHVLFLFPEPLKCVLCMNVYKCNKEKIKLLTMLSFQKGYGKGETF